MNKTKYGNIKSELESDNKIKCMSKKLLRIDEKIKILNKMRYKISLEMMLEIAKINYK